MRYTAKVASGIEALLIHARSGSEWGGGEDPELHNAVMAACDWIEAQADRRPIGKAYPAKRLDFAAAREKP